MDQPPGTTGSDQKQAREAAARLGGSLVCRLQEGTDEIDTYLGTMWVCVGVCECVQVGTCVLRGSLVRAQVPFCHNGQASQGLVETRHAVAIPT